MKTLIFKNTLMKSVSTVENFIKDNNIPHTLVTFLNNEKIPAIDEYDSLVILGGYMSSNDIKEHPFLLEEIKVVQEFTRKDKKVFGICLGAQLMAKAYGEMVYKGPQKEMGWNIVSLNPEFEDENIINTLAISHENNSSLNQIMGFQWHNDTFYLPENAKLLASSKMYKNQAFKFANKSYAMQFHIEVNEDMIKEWLNLDNSASEKILKENKIYLSENITRANNFYDYFFLKL